MYMTHSTVYTLIRKSVNIRNGFCSDEVHSLHLAMQQACTGNFKELYVVPLKISKLFLNNYSFIVCNIFTVDNRRLHFNLKADIIAFKRRIYFFLP